MSKPGPCSRMLYFSSHNLGLFLSSMHLLSGAAKLFSVNTPADAEASAFYLKRCRLEKKPQF